MIKLKFRVTEKTTREHWDKSKGLLGTVKLHPVTGGSEENTAFYEATPSGCIEFGTINQAALDALEIGAEFDVTLDRAR